MSMDFSVDIINLVKHLKAQHETVISNQIGRSGTSKCTAIRVMLVASCRTAKENNS